MADQDADAAPEAESGPDIPAERPGFAERFDDAFGKAFGEHDINGAGDDDEGAVATAKDAPEGEEPEPEDDDGQEKMPEDDDDLEEAAQADAEADSEQEDAEAEEDEEDEDMALHRAYTTLHDKGIPSKVLKRTPKAELIAWARSVDESGKGADGASTAEHDEASKGDAKGAAGEAAQPTPRAWADTRKGLADKLGIDEESAEALKPFHDSHEALSAEVKELRSLVETTTAALREREGQATIDKNVRRLQARYPALKDPAGIEKLVDEAADLLAGAKSRGKKIDETKLFDKAATLAFGAAKRSDMAQLRRNGVSTPPRTAGGFSAPNDEGDYWSKAMSYVEAGRPELASRLKFPQRKPDRK